eukprot:CAMPEP_0172173648 /NCGR_PEP_ID=MMETSP1050-20130122/13183_1 /TAXON_ID=233186 /ORGANISM="Cryptomonas curvata, Strain CCAP979/52" /LENGTH=390 /DNA_ID=CAMNT_0012845451 /DNA_START=189 /DNA_END=1359 /DNA_ORIENTATION=+
MQFRSSKTIHGLKCSIPSEPNVYKIPFQERFQLNRRILIGSGLTVALGHAWGSPVWADNVKSNTIARNAALPVEFNELDPEAANILRQDSAKSGVDVSASDNVFVFRGSDLLKTNRAGAIRYFARRNAVFLGESHSSAADKLLALRIVRDLHRVRGDVVVGLEMVQLPFQQVLDWYVFRAVPSKGSDQVLFQETEWGTRWGWAFEKYLPLFRFCQLRKIRLLALNVAAEVTQRVRESGLSTLSPQERLMIADPDGFRADVMSETFPDYVSAVLRPSFDAHVGLGIYSGGDAELRNFVANRILWDETMASAAARHLAAHPNTMLVGLVGGDHVKTGHGIPARVDRILSSALALPNPRSASVALNPSWRLYSDSRALLRLDALEARARPAPP